VPTVQPLGSCSILLGSCSILFCNKVRRAILDFNRKIGNSSMAGDKLIAQLNKCEVMDLLDVCCVFAYVQCQIATTFGIIAQEKIRILWLEGLQH
jgi:hypothetical protein